MRFSQFIRSAPTRAGFWILCLLAVSLYFFFQEPALLPEETAETPSIILPLVRLLLQIGFFLLLSALLLSFLSTFLAWAQMRRTIAQKAQTLELYLDPPAKNIRQFRLLRTGSLLSFWGSVQTALSFREAESTAPVALRSGSLFSWGKASRQKAVGRLEMRHVKEYRLEVVHFWFRDAFGLFALPLTVPATDVFLRMPDALEDRVLSVKPRRAVELTERVDTMQRVEGDLYNSRRFDTGDDMRRILWSVYARNRELMVRIPEIFEPYASVLTVFASFGALFPATFSPTEEVAQTALDYYKNAVWTVYQNLSKGRQAPRFQMAQEAAPRTHLSKAESVRHAIAAAHWDTAEVWPDIQTQVVIISSLTPLEPLRDMLDRFSGKRDVVLVRLSEAFDSKSKGNLLTRLLFRSSRSGQENRLWRLRGSMLSNQLRQKEEKIAQLLDAYDSLEEFLPGNAAEAVAE